MPTDPHLTLAVPTPPALPAMVGPRPRRHATGRGADLEIAIGRALGRAYPWLTRVQRLPGAGMLWACWPGEHAEAANGSAY